MNPPWDGASAPSLFPCAPGRAHALGGESPLRTRRLCQILAHFLPTRRAQKWNSRTRRKKNENGLTRLRKPALNRVGGRVTPAVLPHHRAYGSVPRRFAINTETDAAPSAATRDPTDQNRRWEKRHACVRPRRSTRDHVRSPRSGWYRPSSSCSLIRGQCSFR